MSTPTTDPTEPTNPGEPVEPVEPDDPIDWDAAEKVANSLGAHTQGLLRAKDRERALWWVLQMSRQHTGIACLNYYELAVLLGHLDDEVTAAASLEWDELLRAVEKLQAAVQAKAAAEGEVPDAV